ncbi:MAG: serine/threonine protein kinase, partial [Deltaproteobacteria bacterium]|nr:serine/threonine protein kinase [Deltaproteobacteria bacterium]
MGDFPIGFGRYQLVERLALGGMAELFVATSPGEHGFQKKVVIKRLLPHLVADETYNAMFIDEAKLTARLVHPKIAQTFELGKVDHALYIAMEYIDGIDVLALLREFAANRRRVEPQLAAWIAHEVLDALDYAHNLTAEDGSKLGVVHRDISPSNVLLSVRGDVKLVDFGIARAVDPDRAHKSKTGTLKGKYGYMSPEQVIEQRLDARSDLFSVGVVLAELLTGRRLFAAANELDVLLMVRDAKLQRFEKYGHDLEPGLADIVRKALKKPVDERWPSAAAFRDALAEWLYEHRHRVAPKQIADVVSELRVSVLERRHKQNAGPVNVEVAVGRAPSDNDGAPLIVIEAGDSMPVVSVSYEAVASPEVRQGRPMSVSELAATTLPVTSRAETIAARPQTIPTTAPQAVPQVPIHVQERSRKGFGDPRQSIEINIDDLGGGVIEIPIGDTISSAVEAITMPDPPAEPHHAGASEDSMMRAFDDLTEEARPRSLVAPPTAEEALRKRPPTPPALADIPEPPDDAGEFNLTSPLRV